MPAATGAARVSAEAGRAGVRPSAAMPLMISRLFMGLIWESVACPFRGKMGVRFPLDASLRRGTPDCQPANHQRWKPDTDRNPLPILAASPKAGI